LRLLSILLLGLAGVCTLFGQAGLPFAGSMPQIASGGGWNSSVTLVNTGTTAALVAVSFFADNGSPLSLPLTYPQPQSPPLPALASTLSATIGPGATLVIQTAGPVNQPTVQGWVSLHSNGNVSGFAIFKETGNLQEAVVPLQVQNASQYRLWFDNTNGYETSVAIANVTNQAAQIPYAILDRSGALPLDFGTITLPPMGHTAFRLDQQSGITANQTGTVRFTTPAGGQISVLGVLFNPTLAVTTIPVTALPAVGGGSMAQLAVGAGWESTITLMNNGNLGIPPESFQLSFTDDNGNALPLPLTFPQSPSTAPVQTSTLSQSIGINGTVVVNSQGSASPPTQMGAVQLTTVGDVSGFAIFKETGNSQEAVVPLQTQSSGSYLLWFDNTNGYTTSAAVANVSTQAVNIPITVRDSTGTTIESSTLNLPPQGHKAFELYSQLPQTVNQTGTVEFDTPPGAEISVLGVRFNPILAFTTIPVIPTGPPAWINISSLDKTVADPFTPLTITGFGFNPVNSGISVMFIPENGNPPVIVPASQASATAIEVAVPPLFDPTSQSFTFGVVDIQVLQFSGTTLWTSNRFTNLQVNRLPAVPAGLPVGAITAAFLNASLNISATVETAAAANTSFNSSSLRAALTQSDADLLTLLASIITVTNSPAQTVQLATANGSAATLNAQELALSDQLIQAMVTALSAQQASPAAIVARGSAAHLASNCPPPSGSAPIFSLVCGVQNAYQNLVIAPNPLTTQLEKKTLADVDLATLGLAATWILGPEVGVPVQVALTLATPMISAYKVTGELNPDGTDVIGSQIETLEVGIEGQAPVLILVDDLAKLWVAATVGTEQQTLGNAMIVSGPNGLLVVQYNGTQFLKMPKTPGPVDTTTLGGTVFTLTLDTIGNGSVTPSIEGLPVDCGTGCLKYVAQLKVTLTPMPAPNTGSVFAGWIVSQPSFEVPPGSCAGAGPCTVAMNGNVTVTATFSTTLALTISTNGTGSGSVNSPEQTDYAPATQVTLTEMPSTGSTFAGWSVSPSSAIVPGSCLVTGPCMVIMNSDVSVTATFNLPPGSGSNFDGTYGGSYNGTAVADGISGPIMGAVAFVITNGVAAMTAPGTGTATVAPTGQIVFGTLIVPGGTCSFSGEITFIGGVATVPEAGSSFNCTASGVGGYVGTSSGTWSANRQ